MISYRVPIPQFDRRRRCEALWLGVLLFVDVLIYFAGAVYFCCS